MNLDLRFDKRMKSEIPKETMAKGAVTFMDVLGWKGIWMQNEAEDIVQRLQQLVDLASKTATKLRGMDFYVDVEVLSISDTIVLLSKGPPKSALKTHGYISKILIPTSIRERIPVRGATAYGEFLTANGTTLIGPAVDEAAAWHEAADWMGVTMTPSAEYQCKPSAPWVKYSRTPVKVSGMSEFYSVNWSTVMTEEELLECFSKAGPLEPVIAPKYVNTLNFHRAMKKSIESS